jgi:chromosomal replication initiator protein
MQIKKQLLKDTTVLFIIANVEKETEIKYREFNIISRKRQYVFARQLAMYFMNKYTKLSLDDIGIIFDRDHSTVIHAKKTIINLKYSDKFIAAMCKNISERIEKRLSRFNKSKLHVFESLLDIYVEDPTEIKHWFTEFLNAK